MPAISSGLRDDLEIWFLSAQGGSALGGEIGIYQNMGLPSKRRTRQSKKERASHFALKAIALTACPNCKKKILPHKVCPYCGKYNGRQVIKVESLTERKKRRETRYEQKKNI